MINHVSLITRSRFALCAPIVCYFVINVKTVQSSVAVGIARAPAQHCRANLPTSLADAIMARCKAS
jgi:hypothetical protein